MWFWDSNRLTNKESFKNISWVLPIIRSACAYSWFTFSFEYLSKSLYLEPSSSSSLSLKECTLISALSCKEEELSSKDRLSIRSPFSTILAVAGLS